MFGVPSDRIFDFIVVGGGSAGSVLGNRLSADPSNRVLVLEAGRPDRAWDLFIQMPAAYAFPIGSRFYDWKYETEPEPHLDGRRVYHCRGKVLGGSGSINGMVYQRGNPLDFDHWAQRPGLQHWDYRHCLPYFKRMETCIAGDDDFRGASGPLSVQRGEGRNPLQRAFLEAGKQAGYSLTEDVNGARQEGFGYFDQSIADGRRVNPSRAYLHTVRQRRNLTIYTRSLVHRVLFDGTRAIGVEFSGALGPPRRVYAKEVVLCGGAFNTPQVLQLSGVGDAAHLRSVGVEVRHHLPGVGADLQDHLETYVQYKCTQPVSIAPYFKMRNRPRVGLEWLLTRPHRGIASTNHAEVGAFIRGNDDVDRPNVQFHFLPIAIRYDSTSPTSGHGYQVHVGPTFSEDRGTVKIKSPDPREHPAVLFNYLSTESTRREWVEAVRIARNVLTQPAFDEFNGGEVSPGPQVESDEEILQWIRRDAETALHPSGSAHMGIDENAVVDPTTMSVHGVSGLRVVDASVFPNVTNSNIYAPVMMVAEKSADLILGNTPLPPEDAPYFRAHPVASTEKPAR